MNEQLKVVCAWCGETLREGTEPASHGICEPCVAEVWSQQAEQRHDDNHAATWLLIGAAVAALLIWFGSRL